VPNVLFSEWPIDTEVRNNVSKMIFVKGVGRVHDLDEQGIWIGIDYETLLV